MQVYGKSDVGGVRTSNQDAFLCGRLSDTNCFAVVCDGMGGASGGNVASTVAAKLLSDRIVHNFQEGMRTVSVYNLLESALAAANIDIFDMAAADPTLRGMGTTAVAVIVSGGHVYVAHVGDSRAYLLENGRLQPITRDHSLVQDMLDHGQITPEQAASHPRKNLLTRAVGVSAEVDGDYTDFDLPPGDKLLLCTDGLTNMVSENKISEILTGNPPDLAVELLIAQANAAGGHDNITAVLIADG